MAQNDGGSAERRSRPSSKAVAAAQSGLFVCNGEYWTLGYNNADFSLKDIKGLGYIQRLLQHPGKEFHSLDLLNGPGGGAELESADKASLLGGATISVGGLGDAGEMLDVKAKQEYQHRLVELREELEDLRERGDQFLGAWLRSNLRLIFSLVR